MKSRRTEHSVAAARPGRRLWAWLVIMVLALAPGCGVEKASPPPEKPAQQAAGGTEMDSLALYGQSLLQMNRDDRQDAAKSLRRALKINPGSAYLHLELARLYTMDKQATPALTEAQRAVEIEPNLVDGWLLMAGILSSQHKVDQAAAAYEKALALDPDQSEARLFLALLYLEVGRFDEAVGTLEEFVKRDPERGLGYYYLGKALAARQDYDRAAHNFLLAAEKSPGLKAALFALADLYTQLGRFDEAEKVFRRILKTAPYSARGHEQLGKLLIRQGRQEEGLQELAKIQNRSTDDPRVLIKVGMIHYELKQYEQAYRKFKAALAKDPNDAKARFYLSVAAFHAGHDEEALKSAAAIGPDHEFYTEARLQMVDILQKRGDLAGAEKVVREGLSHHPDEIELLAALALIKEAAKEYSAGLEIIEQALKLEPGNAEMYFRRGVLLDKSGHQKEGLMDMRRAFELDPKHARALNYVGYVMAEKGQDLAEAEELIRRALGIDPRGRLHPGQHGMGLLPEGRLSPGPEMADPGSQEREKGPGDPRAPGRGLPEAATIRQGGGSLPKGPGTQA